MSVDILHLKNRLGYYVYMLVAAKDDKTAWIKIGSSTNVEKRLNCLCTSVPFASDYFFFRVIQNRSSMDLLEKQLHAAAHQYRVNGEWFEVPNSERDKFNALCEPFLVKSHTKPWIVVDVREYRAEKDEQSIKLNASSAARLTRRIKNRVDFIQEARLKAMLP